MPTVINKLVAYTGGDYTSLNAALSALPASLVSSDEQWNITIGESAAGVYEWTISVDNIFGGKTTDATRYVSLSAQTGKSFKDNAGKLTNALRYNGANGIALNIGSGNYVVLPNYTRISGLQIKGGFQIDFGGNHKLNDCIVSRQGSSSAAQNQDSIWTNSVWITDTNSPFLDTGNGNRTREFHNCHFWAYAPGASSYWAINDYGNFLLKNCTLFGFVGVVSAGAPGSFTGSANNATNLSSVPAGFSGTLLNLTASSQFENVTAGSEDFRVKTGSSLINAGVRDQTYTNDLDIVGSARSITTPTIGAWEFPSVTYSYARPASDITTQWSTSSGTDHFALIDETTASDADYIYATAAGQTDEVKLAAMSAPQAGTDLKVNYRVQGIVGSASVTLSLVCNTTVIATDTARTANGDYTLTVASGTWASVSDWTNMRLRFVSA